jgi:hypothetical protein
MSHPFRTLPSSSARRLTAVLLVAFAGCVADEPDIHGDPGPARVAASSDRDVYGSDEVVGRTSELTVGEVAARNGCSTEGLLGISRQLLDHLHCRTGGQLVRFEHPNVMLTSDRVHPYLSAEGAEALYEVADSATTPIRINSALRTVVDQYVLKANCPVAAEPGRSNHETGKAIDVANWSTHRTALINAGFTHPLPDSDAVHFEADGDDLRTESVIAFQHLWNLNNPRDLLVEDGAAGPQTKTRIAMTPAEGFAVGTDCVLGEEPADAGVPDANAIPEDAALVDSSAASPDLGRMDPRTTKVASGCSCNAATSPLDGSITALLAAGLLATVLRRSSRRATREAHATPSA